jgi:hypothetical protein
VLERLPHLDGLVEHEVDPVSTHELVVQGLGEFRLAFVVANHQLDLATQDACARVDVLLPQAISLGLHVAEGAELSGETERHADA